MDGEEVYNDDKALTDDDEIKIQTTLMYGNHVLEGFGSSASDDGARWDFIVNDGLYGSGDEEIVGEDELNQYFWYLWTDTEMKIWTFPFDTNPVANYKQFIKNIEKNSNAGFC